MSKLKCPICGGEMIENIGSPICHYNQDCPIHDRSIPQEIYDLLVDTKKKLNDTVSVLDDVDRFFDGTIGFNHEAMKDIVKNTLAQINQKKQQ